MKLALSMLCENPQRKTGLTTMFHEFVARGLKLFPEIHWLIFVGSNQEWHATSPQVSVVRDYPANDHWKRRLVADHFRVPPRARAEGADALLTTGFVPMRKSLPTVMHVFSLQHLDPRNQVGAGRALYRRWIMKRGWPKADLVIVNSRFAASQFLTVCPQLRDQLLQSYEGLQHEQFQPAPAPGETARLQTRFQLEPGYFLWISNFYPYKQAELLLAGYARLETALRRKHPLVMVGASWEGALERAQGVARHLSIAENTRFLHWVDDEWLAPLYRYALAFCLASREETFGRCVIESMASGTPCVVNDIPVMHEVTGGHALIIDFQNPDAVATALRTLAANPETRSRLRLAGLAHAQKFTFEKLTTERLVAIQRLVAGRQSGQAFKL